MTKVSTAMVKPILESMYSHRREMVPCFIGAPGIGKTQGIYEFAKEKGVNVVTFILSNTVPSEVSGIRMPDKESKKMEVFDDSRMASLKDGDILFFDEILEAPPMLWSACLTLIQDRIMASGRMLPDVFIVAASNPVASPSIIPASTRDRFQFIELAFDADHWRQWFKDIYHVDPKSIVDYIKEDSDQYNILTPRRATKFYTWLTDGQDDDSFKTKLDIIESMFDMVIAGLFRDLARYIPSPQEQIKAAIESLNIDSSVTKNFEDMSLKSIMEVLQSMPEWEEIQQALATTDFKEQPKYSMPF